MKHILQVGTTPQGIPLYDYTKSAGHYAVCQCGRQHRLPAPEKCGDCGRAV